jgi:hypothetical protein
MQVLAGSGIGWQNELILARVAPVPGSGGFSLKFESDLFAIQ